VVEIQVGLMRIEAMPVVRLGNRVPGPVRGFRVDKNDPRVGMGLVVVRPYVIAPRRGAGLCRAGTLKPGMLVRGVVDDQLADDAYVALVCAGDDAAKIRQRAVVRVDVAIIGNVVAVVAPWRRVERQQPDRIDAEAGDVIELLQQAGKIAHPVVVRVKKRFDVKMIDDRVLVPERVVHHREMALSSHHLAPATGWMRQIAKGSVAGSRRICCTFPYQTKLWPVIRSSTAAAAISDKPQNQSGTSMSHS